MRRAILIGAALALGIAARSAESQQKQRPKPPPPPPSTMDDMAGMHHDSAVMSMPIPMPAGMPMMPGLVGLTPPVTEFLPGRGTDPGKLPAAAPTRIV